MFIKEMAAVWLVLDSPRQRGFRKGDKRLQTIWELVDRWEVSNKLAFERITSDPTFPKSQAAKLRGNIGLTTQTLRALKSTIEGMQGLLEQVHERFPDAPPIRFFLTRAYVTPVLLQGTSVAFHCVSYGEGM
jgi:hypothetical protein